MSYNIFMICFKKMILLYMVYMVYVRLEKNKNKSPTKFRGGFLGCGKSDMWYSRCERLKHQMMPKPISIVQMEIAE